MSSAFIKLSAVTIAYVILSVFLWSRTRNKKFSTPGIIGIGIIYGICSILSTHFGIDYNNMLLLNVRDLGPLAAGLFFHPAAGVIAGLIGGIERYIAGACWGIGTYTQLACGLSTCLAGFMTIFLDSYVLKGRKPKPLYAFIIGAVMEVFHMYAVLITHRGDIDENASFRLSSHPYPPGGYDHA